MNYTNTEKWLKISFILLALLIGFSFCNVLGGKMAHDAHWLSQLLFDAAGVLLAITAVLCFFPPPRRKTIPVLACCFALILAITGAALQRH